MERSVDVAVGLLHGHDRDAVADLARIYEASIPASERKPLEGLLADPACRVVVARADRRMVGFAIVRACPGAALLEYMAVAATSRGGGLGTDLYRAARALAGGPLLIEVDSDREAAPDLATRSRRKAFYRRQGGREIHGLDYVLPLSAAGAPPRMDLMIDGWAEPCVPRAVLQGWLRDIYSQAYGRGLDDARITTMLRGLPACVPVV